MDGRGHRAVYEGGIFVPHNQRAKVALPFRVFKSIEAKGRDKICREKKYDGKMAHVLR